MTFKTPLNSHFPFKYLFSYTSHTFKFGLRAAGRFVRVRIYFCSVRSNPLFIMSRIISVNKTYPSDSGAFRTPKIKKERPDNQSPYELCKNVVRPQPSIIMDAYGQTPDHFYLARKPPAAFFQVKRRLDLGIGSSSEPVDDDEDDDTTTSRNRLRRKACFEKSKAKNSVEKCCPVEKPRYDTSLGQLTKKFLKLLYAATDGVINLNTACAMLAVPKRRLYDITNVLEGAGLIQKTSRNNIQWKGEMKTNGETKSDIEKEIDLLETKENSLDELIFFMNSEIDSIRKNLPSEYSYITSEELKVLGDKFGECCIDLSSSSAFEVVKPNDYSLVVTSNSEINSSIFDEDIAKNAQNGEVVPDEIVNKKTDRPYIVPVEVVSKVKIEKSDTVPEIINRIKTEKSLDTLPQTVDVDIQPDISLPKITDVFCVAVPDCETDDAEYSVDLTEDLNEFRRDAFITDLDDMSPIGPNFLFQMEEQAERYESHYSFSLDDGEGLTDLYDCDFPSP